MTKRLALVAIAALLTAAASPVRAECGSTGVYVFSADWCGVCKATEDFLDSNNVAYRRIETAHDPAIREFMVQRFGSAAVPVVAIDGEYTVGYDEDWMSTMLCLG